ncbi:MAG: hypothetical protein HY343_10775 [Lentisphaerae bacterium]|nr:hypothetical protein [Lentisphaerota bacterium]
MRHTLIVRSGQPENRYGRFTHEILKAEGLMSFETVDIDAEPFPDARPDDVVVLTRCFLRESEIERLCAAVSAGARLVCLQPSRRLAERLGWTGANRVIHPGWIRIREGYPGAGLPIQTHIPVELYSPAKADATLSIPAEAVNADWSGTGHPAVGCRDVGKGKAAVFFYDLPKAVARIRFGNPELASHITTGLWSWLHAGDLFAGHLDGRVNHLPQADFHGQLLARVLTDVCATPLARFWYYEKWAHRSAAIFQSDEDGSTPEQVRELSDAVLARGGRGTFYLMNETQLKEPDVAALRAKGHTFAPHVDPWTCKEEWAFAFPDAVRRETEAFRKRFGACSTTIQCHCAPWQGYMDWVRLFLENGYRLLFVYMSIPVSLMNRYLCGSGRPLRFFDDQGVQHDCWQQPLITYDDATLKERIANNPGALLAEFVTQVRSALDRTHTAVSILSHPISYSTYSKPFMDACFDFLRREDIPIHNGDAWCDFLDRRSRVTVRQERISEAAVRLSIRNLTCRLPLMLPFGDGLEVEVNGVRVEGVRCHRLETDFLVVQLEAGNGLDETHVEVRRG